jgi:opacity protein-like surface antigen
MMVSRKLFLTAALALSITALAPARASADWLFTPFIGGTFGGSADVTDVFGDFEEEFNRKLTYGLSLAYLGGGIAGFEIDFGYSPNFFGADGDEEIDFIGDGNVTTLMANVIFSAPTGGVRPYASFGGGLIKSRLDEFDEDFFNENNLGFNAGAGVMGFFTDNVGLRGDIRYFRSVNRDDEDLVDLSLGSFKFWRGTVGVTLRF